MDNIIPASPYGVRVFFFCSVRFFVNHAFCSVRGGPTKKKKHGGVFFFAPCAAGRPKKNTGRVFFFAPCAAGRPKKNTGRVFFFVPCAAGQPTKKKHGARFFLLRARRANQKKKKTGRVFFLLRARRVNQQKNTRGAFFCSVRGGPTNNKTTGVFFAAYAAGRGIKQTRGGALLSNKQTWGVICFGSVRGKTSNKNNSGVLITGIPATEI